VTIVSFINGALLLSIVFNTVRKQDLNAVSRSTAAIDIVLGVTCAPDQTFVLFETYDARIDAKETQQRLHWLAEFLNKKPGFQGFYRLICGSTCLPR
jgi:hypothetical protein